MYDFVVLGGGSAGYAAARTAVELGMKTAVLDGSERLGGLCILRGCMPSKALIESANRFRTLRRAEEFGLRASGLEVRGEEVVARQRRLIGEFADYREGQLEDGRFDLIRGQGRFLGPGWIEARLRDGTVQQVEAASVLIATGSSITIPPVPGLAETGYWTSDDVLEVEDLPRSVAVLGGGAIAVELAHYFEGLGVNVTVIQRSGRVLKEMDEDVSNAVEAAFRERGMAVYCGTALRGIERDGGSKVIRFDHDGEERTVVVDEIVAALGRAPAIRDLDLESVGVKTERGYIRTDLGQRTSADGIYAAGDVSGPLEVVHLAVAQGETAAWNVARDLGFWEGPVRAMDYRLKLFGVFCEPEAALVGYTEAELRGQGRKFRVATYPFDDHGKSLVLGETRGFVKLIADEASGEILGGAVVGPQAVELIHEVAVAMYFRATAGQLAGVPFYHPTLSEIWTYPAEELAELGKEME